MGCSSSTGNITEVTVPLPTTLDEWNALPIPTLLACLQKLNAIALKTPAKLCKAYRINIPGGKRSAGVVLDVADEVRRSLERVASAYAQSNATTRSDASSTWYSQAARATEVPREVVVCFMHQALLRESHISVTMPLNVDAISSQLALPMPAPHIRKILAVFRSITTNCALTPVDLLQWARAKSCHIAMSSFIMTFFYSVHNRNRGSLDCFEFIAAVDAWCTATFQEVQLAVFYALLTNRPCATDSAAVDIAGLDKLLNVVKAVRADPDSYPFLSLLIKPGKAPPRPLTLAAYQTIVSQSPQVFKQLGDLYNLLRTATLGHRAWAQRRTGMHYLPSSNFSFAAWSRRSISCMPTGTQRTQVTVVPLGDNGADSEDEGEMPTDGQSIKPVQSASELTLLNIDSDGDEEDPKSGASTGRRSGKTRVSAASGPTTGGRTSISSSQPAKPTRRSIAVDNGQSSPTPQQQPMASGSSLVLQARPGRSQSVVATQSTNSVMSMSDVRLAEKEASVGRSRAPSVAQMQPSPSLTTLSSTSIPLSGRDQTDRGSARDSARDRDVNRSREVEDENRGSFKQGSRRQRSQSSWERPVAAASAAPKTRASFVAKQREYSDDTDEDEDQASGRGKESAKPKRNQRLSVGTVEKAAIKLKRGRGQSLRSELASSNGAQSPGFRPDSRSRGTGNDASPAPTHNWPRVTATAQPPAYAPQPVATYPTYASASYMQAQPMMAPAPTGGYGYYPTAMEPTQMMGMMGSPMMSYSTPSMMAPTPARMPMAMAPSYGSSYMTPPGPMMY